MPCNNSSQHPLLIYLKLFRWKIIHLTWWFILKITVFLLIVLLGFIDDFGTVDLTKTFMKGIYR